MKLSIKIIVGTAIVVASVVAATFGASAPAAAREQTLRTHGATALTDVSARKRVAKKKKYGNTSVRIVKLSARASLPPNANRPYYRPVPTFYPFGQRRGYF